MTYSNVANRIKNKMFFNSILVSFSSIIFSNLKLNNINRSH